MEVRIKSQNGCGVCVQHAADFFQNVVEARQLDKLYQPVVVALDQLVVAVGLKVAA